MIRICILLVSLSSLAFIYTDEDLPSSYETLNNTNYAYPNVELFEEIDNSQSLQDNQCCQKVQSIKYQFLAQVYTD